MHRRVALDVDLDGDQAAKALTHVACHVVAGHTLSMNSQDVETVAESAAFVVLNHYGLNSSGYTFPYVASWAQDRAVLKRNLGAVQGTAHRIIVDLEGENVQREGANTRFHLPAWLSVRFSSSLFVRLLGTRVTHDMPTTQNRTRVTISIDRTLLKQVDWLR